MLVKIFAFWLCMCTLSITLDAASNESETAQIEKTINKSIEENVSTVLEEDNDTDPVKSMMAFLKDHMENQDFNRATEKNVVLIMGDEGSGRSTLSLLLAGNEFEGVETHSGSKQFMTADKNGYIEVGWRPEESNFGLMDEPGTGNILFDCPGFIGPRGVEYDILVSNLIKNVLHLAKSVKFVFTIPHSSVALMRTHDFIEMAQQITNFFKSIDKYHDSIALVVTKVDSHHIYKTDSNQLKNDEQEIKRIVKYLTVVKEEFDKIMEKENQSTHYNHLDILRLIEILLENEQRIGILHRPDRNGSVKDMPILQAEKTAITSMINDHLNFVKPEDCDFKYAISRQSENDITLLMQDIIELLISDLTNIGVEIKQFYAQQEEQISDSKMYGKMKTAAQKLSELVSDEPKQFFSRFDATLKSLGIHMSANNSDRVLGHIESLNYLKNLHNFDMTMSNQMSDGLQDIKDYFNDSMKWYNFTTELRSTLSGENSQKIINQYKDEVERLLEQFSADEPMEKNIDETNLKQFLGMLDSDIYDKVQNMTVNTHKLNTVKKILGQIINTTDFMSNIGARLKGLYSNPKNSTDSNIVVQLKARLSKSRK